MITDKQKEKIMVLLESSDYMVKESLSMSGEGEYYKGKISAIQDIIKILNEEDETAKCPSCGLLTHKRIKL